MLLSEIELEKIYTFTVKSDVLSQEGMRAVYIYLVGHYPNSYIGDLYDSNNFEWKLESKTGEYRGKLVTQLSKYLAIRKKITLTALEKQEIGNIISKYKPVSEDYKFRFTDNINWSSGDYGDNGSCFWGDRSGAKDIMKKNGSQAICFYNTLEDSLEGIARAWFTPTEDYVVVWNGYSGYRWGDSTHTIAIMLSQFFKLPVKRITLENNDSSSGTIYINSGRGYIIGEKQVIDDIEHIDFEWKADERVCDHCDCFIHEGDEYWVDDEALCEDCFHEVACTCDRCGEAIYLDDANTIGYDYYCNRCTWRVASRCEHCDELTLTDDLHLVDSNEYWCEDCMHNHTFSCDNCGERFTEVHDHDTKGPLCNSCYAEAVQEKEDDDIIESEERSENELDSAGAGVLERETT